jgi:hypothetical protein
MLHQVADRIHQDLVCLATVTGILSHYPVSDLTLT